MQHNNVAECIKFKTNIIRLLAECQSIFIYLCFIPTYPIHNLYKIVYDTLIVALNSLYNCGNFRHQNSLTRYIFNKQGKHKIFVFS